MIGRRTAAAAVVAFAFGIGGLATVAAAQEPTTTTVPAPSPTTTGAVAAEPAAEPAGPAPSQADLDRVDDRLAELQADLDVLSRESARNETSVDSLEAFLMWAFAPIAVLVGLLTAGGVLGMVNSVRAENRATQLHQLAVAGEATGQARAEQSHVTFLEASQKTLNLVNETLELAKDASARAATSMADRATRKMNELSARAHSELSQYLISGNFKGLVENSTTTKVAFEIASELVALEGLFALQDITLTAPCLFMRGLERHLRNDPPAAIAALGDAVATLEGDQYADLAYYWIAYENNNVGEYGRAESTFRRAKERAAQSGRHGVAATLAIKELESRFFGIAAGYDNVALAGLAKTGDSGGACGTLDSALSKLDQIRHELGALDDLGEGAAQARNLLGNLDCWTAAKWHRLSDPDKELRAWQNASGHYTSITGTNVDWYIDFGVLEAAWHRHHLGDESGDEDRVTAERYAELAGVIAQKIHRRYEHRSQVMFYEAQLVCRGRAAVLSSASAVAAAGELRTLADQLQRVLADIRDEVTVYSAVTKANLTQRQLDREVAGILDEMIQGLRGGPQEREA